MPIRLPRHDVVVGRGVSIRAEEEDPRLGVSGDQIARSEAGLGG